MLIDDNEYGAPWNDQYYVVTYDCDGEIATDTMVLSGPRRLDYDELKVNAQMSFGMYPILNIQEYHEVYR